MFEFLIQNGILEYSFANVCFDFGKRCVVEFKSYLKLHTFGKFCTNYSGSDPVYPIEDLISDIGGTAGLFLGLSLVQIGLLLKRCIIRGIVKFKNGITGKRTKPIPTYLIPTLKNHRQIQ